MQSQTISATAGPNGVSLELDGGPRTYDHVLLCTGYDIDVAKLPFLTAPVLRGVATEDGFPLLGRGYESSAPGLHFIGASAMRSYGPLMRFVWGAGYAARSITRFVSGERKRQAVTTSEFRAAGAPARHPKPLSR